MGTGCTASCGLFVSSPALRLWLLTIAVLLAAIAGCGGESGDDRPERDVSLLLDFTPNAVHTGIYTATRRGYDRAEGVRLAVRPPGASTDSVRLLAGGRVDLAVLDIHDLGLAREKGSDVVGVAALVQRPLAALLAQPGTESPRELEGERVGVSGLPSDVAVLRSIVAGAGGDPDKVRETTIGFEAVPALLGGRVAAATAFWNVEGVALKQRRPQIREFRLDDFGAPSYPELVLAARRETVDEEPEVIRATVAALQRGYSFAQSDPESAVGDLLAGARGANREDLLAQLDAVSPVLIADAPVFGALHRGRLREWAEWDVEFGILRRRPDVDEAFRFDLVPPKRPE